MKGEKDSTLGLKPGKPAQSKGGKCSGGAKVNTLTGEKRTMENTMRRDPRNKLGQNHVALMHLNLLRSTME